MENLNKISIPEIGDKIYVPSSRYVYRGEDDFDGGISTIDRVEYSKHLPKDHFNYIMVGLKERPNSMYNYRNLLDSQEDLKKRYNGIKSKPNPDLRDEYNNPNSDWK